MKDYIFIRTRCLSDYELHAQVGMMDMLVFSYSRSLGIKALQVSDCTGGGKVKHAFPV